MAGAGARLTRSLARSAVPQPLRYVWAAPATVLGLLCATVSLWRGRVSVVQGVIEAHGPLLRWALRRLVPLAGGAAAVTFGHVVLGTDARALERTRAHERVHVRQYERWGPLFLPAYLLAGAHAWLRGGHPYRDNRFEIEARAGERASPAIARRVPRPEHHGS